MSNFKRLICSALMLLSFQATASTFSGAVAGAVAGAAVVSTSSGKPTSGSSTKTSMVVGRNLVVCRVSLEGTCDIGFARGLPVLAHVRKMGYTKVHSQFWVQCGDASYTGVCIVMEVSK